MTPAHNTTISAAAAAKVTGFRWNSPIPYLFGGLALMLSLIACALIILACSYKKPYASSDSTNDNNNNNASDQEKPSTAEFPGKLSPEMEPKIVIIMPGDVNPTYIAKPVPPTSHHLEQV